MTCGWSRKDLNITRTLILARREELELRYEGRKAGKAAARTLIIKTKRNRFQSVLRGGAASWARASGASHSDKIATA